MQFENLLYDVQGPMGLITINRPAKHNAISLGTLEELHAAVDNAAFDDDVKSIVITGAGGRAFASGSDLSEVRYRDFRKALEPIVQGLADKLERTPKPTIAAVNGAAVGAGCEIAVACDFRIASEHAMFSEAWIKLGVMAPLGGMFLLPQIVGLSKATEMLMLGTQVGAEEAMSIGLANKVVPADALLEEAMVLGRRLADGPARAQAVIKEGLRRGMESTLAAEWEHNIYAQSMLISGGDFAEAVQAFKEKRKPIFD